MHRRETPTHRSLDHAAFIVVHSFHSYRASARYIAGLTQVEIRVALNAIHRHKHKNTHRETLLRMLLISMRTPLRVLPIFSFCFVCFSFIFVHIFFFFSIFCRFFRSHNDDWRAFSQSVSRSDRIEFLSCVFSVFRSFCGSCASTILYMLNSHEKCWECTSKSGFAKRFDTILPHNPYVETWSLPTLHWSLCAVNSVPQYRSGRCRIAGFHYFELFRFFAVSNPHQLSFVFRRMSWKVPTKHVRNVIENGERNP